MKKLLVLIVFWLLFSCDYVEKKLEIKNNSKITIYSSIELDTTIDTNISKSLQEILPNQSSWPTLIGGKGKNIWEDCINKYSIDSTLYIYFFDTNKISNSIIKNREYKRLDLKVKDLDKLAWVIQYPETK